MGNKKKIIFVKSRKQNHSIQKKSIHFDSKKKYVEQRLDIKYLITS